MRKTIQILFLFMVILSMLNCKTEKQKDQEIRTEVLSGHYNKARLLINKYY